MKKFVLLIMVFMVSFFTMAQSVNKVVTITSDTLNAVETKYFNVQPITATYQSLSITATFTELGGTSDGTAYLQGSNDGVGYINITSEAGKNIFYTNDTLTITDGAVWAIQLYQPSFKHYRIKAVGTANDTTLVSPTYIIKK